MTSRRELDTCPSCGTKFIIKGSKRCKSCGAFLIKSVGRGRTPSGNFPNTWIMCAEHQKWETKEDYAEEHKR